jgi:hypothetical protein
MPPRTMCEVQLTITDEATGGVQASVAFEVHEGTNSHLALPDRSS